MKRNLLTLLLTILGGVLSVPTWAQQRSLSQASGIARQLQSEIPQFVKQELMPVGGNLLSLQIGRQNRAAQRMPSFAIADQQPFYVFANEEKGGFVIVAGDERMGDVLGYSENSLFDVADIPAGVADLLLFYARVYAAVQDGYTTPGSVKKVSWDPVTPIIKTQWGQNAPYNAWCPMSGGKRTITGCGATAMAQIMKRWNYPVSGHGSLSYTTDTDNLDVYFNFDVNSFEWNDMKNAYSSYESASEVAKLIYACGVSLAMDYTPDWSASNTLDMAYSLIHVFDYADAVHYNRSYHTGDDWKAIIQRELSAGRPIVYRGANSKDEGGHIFIIDGVTKPGKLHVNWGWNGNSDGYFELDNLMPTDKNDFRYGHEMVAKISPEAVEAHEDVFYADEFRAMRKQDEYGKYVRVEMDNLWCYSNVACPRDTTTMFEGMIGAALYDLSGNFVRILCGGGAQVKSLYGFYDWWWYIYDSDSQVEEGVYILRPVVYSYEYETISPIRTIQGLTDSCYLIAENGEIRITDSLSDGISSPKTTKKTCTQTYSLDGRRLSSTPQRGVYVRNGKKYLAR